MREPGAAAINQELFEPDSAFLEKDRLRCDDDSETSSVCSTYGIGFLRLGLTAVDLSNPQHVEQAKGQIQVGDFIWMSLPCTERSSWQFMNIHRHGAAYEEKLKKRRAKIRKMLKLATAVAEEKIAQGCSVTFEWPKDLESLLWQDPVFLAFEKKMNMKRVTFHGCALGLMGLKDPIKKPWCVSTTSLRVLQLFGQRQCDKSHSHEPAEGSKTKATGHYNNQFAQLVVEALFPWRYYRSVPSVRADNAYVTKNLSRNKWLRDLSGIQAVQAEATGLRSNSTWDEHTVRLLAQLRQECRETGRKVQIAEDPLRGEALRT